MLTIGIYGPRDRVDERGNPLFMSHDHNITFMRDGSVIDAIELERYTGIKHDNRLHLFIEELIDAVWDGEEPLRFVLVNSFVSCGFISESGLLKIEEPQNILLSEIMIKSSGEFYSHGVLVDCDYYVISHEFAHIATNLPFTQTFKSQSLLFHLDGGASQSNHSMWYYDGEKIELLDYGWETLKKPVNIFNDNRVSAWILEMDTSEHLAVPGKLMGYASWGVFDKNLHNWLIEHNWFLSFNGKKEEFLQLLSEFMGYKISSFSLENSLFQSIACSFQTYFKESVIGYIKNSAEKYTPMQIYYSGGASLNIMTNSALEKELEKTHLFIPPAPSDCGLSLGAASYLEWLEKGELEHHSPYLNSIGLPEEKAVFDKSTLVESVVKGEIATIAFSNGEFGPRALGHRSIVARPDSIPLRVKVSEEMKKREWYRPVAPIILKEIAVQALQDYNENSTISDYMLGCWEVKEEWRVKLAGVIHIDGTVRAQVIDDSKEYYHHLYDLLTTLWKKYGIAGIINTSLNTKGKPIVHNLGLFVP